MAEKKVTILLVEDEPAIRRLIGTALERSGYHVREARHGAEALDKFDDSIDLLLVDMRLPKLSGEQLMARLRERQPALKVLAISGYPLNAPADVPFLAKPFTRDALIKAIQDVLGTPAER
jgi:CheY-like chemotaxis protein